MEQTRYPRLWPVFTALKIALINESEAGLSLLDIGRNKGKGTPFYSCFGSYRLLAYTIWACEVCMIWRKLKAARKIHCKSPSWRPDGLTTLDWFTVHEATFSVYFRESAYVRSLVGCGTVQQTLFCMSHKYFKATKSDASKQDFEIKLNWTWHAQSTVKQ